jgi:hypothetical protein
MDRVFQNVISETNLPYEDSPHLFVGVSNVSNTAQLSNLR